MIAEIAIIFFASIGIAQIPEPDGWTILKSPTNETLRKLFFIDTNNGWAVSLNGTIINTTNSGETWEIQNSTVISPLLISFL